MEDDIADVREGEAEVEVEVEVEIGVDGDEALGETSERRESSRSFSSWSVLSFGRFGVAFADVV